MRQPPCRGRGLLSCGVCLTHACVTRRVKVEKNSTLEELKAVALSRLGRKSSGLEGGGRLRWQGYVRGAPTVVALCWVVAGAHLDCVLVLRNGCVGWHRVECQVHCSSVSRTRCLRPE